MSLYSLDGGGVRVKVSSYGALVQSVWAPDRSGEVKNVVLGFAAVDGYVANFEHPVSGGSGATHFGATIGRYANRIADGRFSLDGNAYTLPQNNGPNTLHGGPMGYDTQVWDAIPTQLDDRAAVALTHVDPDGKNGFPGNVTLTVTYSIDAAAALRIDYQASSDQPTVVNFTNHSYFNLAGEGSGDVYGALLAIEADHYTPVNEHLVPTGEFAPVADTPFDFRTPKPIGRDISLGHEQLVRAHGFDHNFVLRGSGCKRAATVEDPASGRTLTAYTTEPGMQLYTSNSLLGDVVGVGGRTYRQGSAFALETQHYPDSPHHLDEPGWPSVVLRPGQTLNSTTIFEFGVSAGS